MTIFVHTQYYPWQNCLWCNYHFRYDVDDLACPGWWRHRSHCAQRPWPLQDQTIQQVRQFNIPPLHWGMSSVRLLPNIYFKEGHHNISHSPHLPWNNKLSLCIFLLWSIEGPKIFMVQYERCLWWKRMVDFTCLAC